MGDENPIRTLGDYSKLSQEGYRNIIEFPVGNNVDSNQHLKDFLKLVDSLDLDGANRERTRLLLFQFSLRDQASNWLERLPAGSITTWEDLTTHFLAQFFPPGRTVKLRNDILMFQQHHGESLSKEWTRSNPQPQPLRTTFEARVQDYMAAHTERMERFKNAIFKQREELNDRVTEMFGLLKELTTSKAPEKDEEEKNDIYNVATIDCTKETGMEVSVKEAETPNGAENGAKNKPIKKAEKEEVVETPISRPVEYYLKHRINEKLIEGLVDNHRFNDSLSRARVGKVKGKTYNVSPWGPVYDAILKKRITKKEDIGGNFEIPCSIGGLKHVNALVDQGSDVNVMPYSTYMKFTDERPAETDIRLSLASHSYIYPIGIAEDVLVEVISKREKLEVLRKFHWTILDDDFNRIIACLLTPLLSKPGE
ncbi:MAK10-like protein [Tanacetum coccineum]